MAFLAHAAAGLGPFVVLLPPATLRPWLMALRPGRMPTMSVRRRISLLEAVAVRRRSRTTSSHALPVTPGRSLVTTVPHAAPGLNLSLQQIALNRGHVVINPDRQGTQGASQDGSPSQRGCGSSATRTDSGIETEISDRIEQIIWEKLCLRLGSPARPGWRAWPSARSAAIRPRVPSCATSRRVSCR